jgi:hypothetical protein
MPMLSDKMLNELSRLAGQFDTLGPTVYTTLVSNVYEPFIPGKNNRWALLILQVSLADTRITWRPTNNNANQGMRLESSNQQPIIFKFSDLGSMVQYPWFVRSPSFGSTITWAEVLMIP